MDRKKRKKRELIREKLSKKIKSFWRKKGNPSVIAARHSEFVIEPKIFMGDQLNPEILKLLVVNYLKTVSQQDSGIGNKIDVSPEKLVIKGPKGKPLVVVRDKQLIKQYIAKQA